MADHSITDRRYYARYVFDESGSSSDDIVLTGRVYPELSESDGEHLVERREDYMYLMEAVAERNALSSAGLDVKAYRNYGDFKPGRRYPDVVSQERPVTALAGRTYYSGFSLISAVNELGPYIVEDFVVRWLAARDLHILGSEDEIEGIPSEIGQGVSIDYTSGRQYLYPSSDYYRTFQGDVTAFNRSYSTRRATEVVTSGLSWGPYPYLRNSDVSSDERIVTEDNYDLSVGPAAHHTLWNETNAYSGVSVEAARIVILGVAAKMSDLRMVSYLKSMLRPYVKFNRDTYDQFLPWFQSGGTLSDKADMLGICCRVKCRTLQDAPVSRVYPLRVRSDLLAVYKDLSRFHVFWHLDGLTLLDSTVKSLDHATSSTAVMTGLLVTQYEEIDWTANPDEYTYSDIGYSSYTFNFTGYADVGGSAYTWDSSFDEAFIGKMEESCGFTDFDPLDPLQNVDSWYRPDVYKTAYWYGYRQNWVGDPPSRMYTIDDGYDTGVERNLFYDYRYPAAEARCPTSSAVMALSGKLPADTDFIVICPVTVRKQSGSSDSFVVRPFQSLADLADFLSSLTTALDLVSGYDLSAEEDYAMVTLGEIICSSTLENVAKFLEDTDSSSGVLPVKTLRFRMADEDSISWGEFVWEESS